MLTEVSPRPVETFSDLRKRVARLFMSVKLSRDPKQQSLFSPMVNVERVAAPTTSLLSFIDFLAAAIPQGEVYLFGGVLRDLAIFGRRGFNSDVDLVVEGEWDRLVSYFNSIGAKQNKFGGFRLNAGDWPIDIWNAEDTWAIRNRLVPYEGIASLTQTTVLNWDAILMNWRTGAFVCEKDYLTAIHERSLDVVLEENPNPLGMAIRVFRHLATKDARKIGCHAVKYLEQCTERFSFSELSDAELQSYGDSYVDPALYHLFSLSKKMGGGDVAQRFNAAVAILEKDGVEARGRQLTLLQK